MMHDNLSLRKAAVLIACLDEATAEALLAKMGEHQADEIRRAATQLEAIAPEERNAVLAEFRALQSTSSFSAQDYRDGFRRSATSGERRRLVPDRFPSGIDLESETVREIAAFNAERDQGPFEFLAEADLAELVTYLEKEHPQAVALVLSYLAPEQAGEVVARLPSALRIEVIHRLADLTEPDQAVVREIASSLKSWLQSRLRENRGRSLGLEAVRKILGASGPTVEEEVLQGLAVRDESLADRLRTNAPSRIDVYDDQDIHDLDEGESFAPPSLEELVAIDVAVVAESLEAILPDVAALALSATEPAVVRQILKQLPRHQANHWRRRLKDLGPVRLSEVEASQRELEQAVLRRLNGGRKAADEGRSLPLAA